ncbi:MAG TPA: hypothetical protein VHE61_19110 [Opitutaceae bacterium]|nr:hypothetical protein [Opitutaceae bacterium]
MQNRMTIAEYEDVLRLIDSMASLLKKRSSTSASALRRELRQLVLDFELLRAGIGQAPAVRRQRN